MYPAGTLVRLRSGEVAVVTRVHAPDPYRPRVRVLFDAAGAPVDAVIERSLWLEAAETPAGAASIRSPLDPRDFGIDPLLYVPGDGV